MAVTEMMPSVLEGKIRGLYVVGENPVMSDPDTTHIRKILAALDFLLLQEIFPSETSHYADILLPGVTFAEKSGTFTNTERRVQRVQQAIDPPGVARPDWQITSEIARRALRGDPARVRMEAPFAKWDYADTWDILTEINAVAPSYAGITKARLERGERLQWPCTSTDHPGTPILHAKRFTRGLGRFFPVEHVPPAEEPTSDFPMILSTGRVLYHWHGGEMTRRASRLLEVYPEARVEVNAVDAGSMGLMPGNAVRVTSRRGSITAKAWVTDRVPPGMVFANFHFPENSANILTISALDPEAKIPEYKVAAVRLEAVS